jgi:hypothetical protein
MEGRSCAGVVSCYTFGVRTTVEGPEAPRLCCDARRRAGALRSRRDVDAAVEEGAVERVRPKVMTVTAIMAGLVPILWSQGTGADMMKRIAAPMVGGMLTSTILTLAVIPVVYSVWQELSIRPEPRTPSQPERREMSHV